MDINVINIAIALICVAVIAWLVNGRVSVPINVRPVINIVLGLIVVGVALWLIDTYIPMAGGIKAILNVVVFIAACVGVLRAFGLWGAVVRMWDNLTHRVARVE
jgi:hypothetical protein